MLLRRAARELERLEATRLSRTRARLRPAHVAVVTALLDASPLTPSELSVRCEVDPSTMTGLLRTLEERDLVVREKNLKDLRSVAMTLTPRGRAAARVAAKARAEAEAQLKKALDAGLADSVSQQLEAIASTAQILAAEAEANRS